MEKEKKKIIGILEDIERLARIHKILLVSERGQFADQILELFASEQLKKDSIVIKFEDNLSVKFLAEYFKN